MELKEFVLQSTRDICNAVIEVKKEIKDAVIAPGSLAGQNQEASSIDFEIFVNTKNKKSTSGGVNGKIGGVIEVIGVKVSGFGKKDSGTIKENSHKI